MLAHAADRARKGSFVHAVRSGLHLALTQAVYFLTLLRPGQADFNKQLSGIRAGAERAVASVKTWRLLSEEGGRCGPPISNYGEMLAAVTGCSS